MPLSEGPRQHAETKIKSEMGSTLTRVVQRGRAEVAGFKLASQTAGVFIELMGLTVVANSAISFGRRRSRTEEPKPVHTDARGYRITEVSSANFGGKGIATVFDFEHPNGTHGFIIRGIDGGETVVTIKSNGERIVTYR